MKILRVLLALALTAGAAPAAEKFGEAAKAKAQGFVKLLKEKCPVADPADQAAYDLCRKALFQSADAGAFFAPRVRWGGLNPDLPIWQQKDTEFDSKLWISLYLPLMMFDGEYELKSDGLSYWPLLHVRAAFRGRLQPGQFPYPFWHSPEKWAAYDAMDELIFRIDPVTSQVTAVFRADNPERGPVIAQSIASHVFDGKWMWTDEDGRAQPAVTLYDGLFDARNPFKAAMEASYRDFATELRDQSCLSCHTPSNPQKMRTLILLQTPAHAAGEIKRLIEAVDRGEMPLEEWGAAAPLAGAKKEGFLAKARIFEETSRQAFDWEKQRAVK